MNIDGLIWLDEIIEKISRKHSVQPSEVREVLSNKPYFRFVESGLRFGENVYVAMGQASNGRYLMVFFIYKKDKRAMIISVRDMTEKERRLYEKK